MLHYNIIFIMILNYNIMLAITVIIFNVIYVVISVMIFITL